MKIRRQISAKAIKRFKMMVLAALGLLAVSYFTDDIGNNMVDYQWFVDAATDESADPALPLVVTIDDIEDKMFYQINKNITGDGRLIWRDKEYKHFAYIQRANGFVEGYYDGEDLYGSYCMR